MSAHNIQNRISKTAQNAAESSRQFVRQHDVSTSAVTFGLGVAAGISLVFLLYDRRHQHDAAIANRLREQMRNAMASAIPDRIANFRR